jgi:Tol biopolymer transport system component
MPSLARLPVAPPRVLACLLTGLAALAGLPASEAAAYPRPGRTELVTVGLGGEADSYSHAPDISNDGRFVAFQSDSTNLIPGDTNKQTDVFVRNLATGVTTRASESGDGAQANFNSAAPSISPSGRFVAFSTRASDLLPDDLNGTWDIVVKDLQTGGVRNASVASDGTQADGLSASPAASALDHGIVAFESDATNLVPGDTNGLRDVFVHDLTTGQTRLVSTAADGTQGNAAATQASISADGRLVVFRSGATNLVPGDANAFDDIFVKNLETGAIRIASVSSDGLQANFASGGPKISQDGSTVLFSTAASNLVPADTNGRLQSGTPDVFVHDLATGLTERVSVTSDGVEGNGNSGGTAISPDGRYVTIMSEATNLVSPDGNFRPDLFLHDRVTGTTERISVNADGSEARNGLFGTSSGAASADGGVVAFASDNPGIVPGDTGTGFDSDIFVRRRGPALGISDLRVFREGDEVVIEGTATASGVVAAAVADPPDDGDEAFGADLSRVSVVVRPEREDLLIDIGVTRFPGATPPNLQPTQLGPGGQGHAGVPGVVYAVALRAGGASYEVRATRSDAATGTLGAPVFTLVRCETACLETARLAGGYGATGQEIRVAVPFSALGVSAGATLTQVRTVVGLGDGITGVLHPLDDLPLPDIVVASPSVDVGVGPADGPEGGVEFLPASTLSGGVFGGRLPASSSSRAWARICLMGSCGSASAPVA